MCTVLGGGEIIILSDDEQGDVELDSSVLFVEVKDLTKKNNDCVLSPSAVDEDLVVTFSRRADLLPHARYDCPVHAFTATECEVTAPVDSNQLICKQCFCYICDKLASECEVWCCGVCHCNSHKKSTFWNNLRNHSLLRGLQTFNLTLSEIDTHLRHAEMLLQNFKIELSEKFVAYLNGKPAEEYGVQLPVLIHDYYPVYKCVASFLNLADEQNSRAAAIMKLGAAEDFVRHLSILGDYTLPTMACADVTQARLELMNRVVSSLQRQIVRGELPTEFIHKLQEFYKRISLPPQLKSMKNSLCVRPWDDILLVSVLKGQNVSGVRKHKGKKDVLAEQISVVLLRMELLQEQQRYRELCRYLRVVQTDDSKIFQQILELVPFFQCLGGDFFSALQTLLLSHTPRLTPHLFLLYFQIFQNAKAPVQIVSPRSELRFPCAPWECIKGAVKLKPLELVKFALKVQSSSSAVSDDTECWKILLSLVCSPCGSHIGLPQPSLDYLHESKDVVRSILLSQDSVSFYIPRHFQEVYPEQALLLLVTGALALRVLKGPLSPVLPVLQCFQKNLWALQWLCENLTLGERLTSFVHELSEEIRNTTGHTSMALALHDQSIDSLHRTIVSSMSSLPHLDQQSCAEDESTRPK